MAGYYSTRAWRARRMGQLQAEPLCRMCSASGQITAATVADHIVPHRGDHALFFDGALQSLCAPCHNSRKQADEARGYALDLAADGWPIDARHPANRKG